MYESNIKKYVSKVSNQGISKTSYIHSNIIIYTLNNKERGSHVGIRGKKKVEGHPIDTKYMHIKREIDCHIRDKNIFSSIAALKMAISVRAVRTLSKNLRTEMKLKYIPVINVAKILAKMNICLYI